MTYTIETPQPFLRRAKEVFRASPDARERFAALVEALRQDPFQPGLLLQPLRDEWEGFYAVSLTHAYHVTLTITGRTIALLDIGSHDEVFR